MMTPQEKAAWDLQAYGASEADVRKAVEGSISFKTSGPLMVAMGMMSDAQEMLAMSTRGTQATTNETVRQMLNRAKFVIAEYVKQDYRKMERFYVAIGKLTLNHGVINDVAAVTAKDLGEELDKVNPDWYKDCQ